MTKRLQRVEMERSHLEQDLKQALAKTQNVEQEMVALRRQQVDRQQQIDILVRERNILARTKETQSEHMKRLNHETVVCEYSRRKIEHELDDAMQNVVEITKQLGMVEKERDKHNLLAQELAQQVRDAAVRTQTANIDWVYECLVWSVKTFARL